MVVLKKIKASSLNEVIVATIIIVVIFGIAIATLSNIMQNILRRNTQAAHTRLNEVIYLYQHDVIKLPYTSNEETWFVYISKQKNNDLNEIEFEITSKKTNRTITRKIIDNEKD